MSERAARQGTLFVLGAALLWGTLGPTFRGLMAVGASPTAVGFWRAALGAAFMALWLTVARQGWPTLTRRDLPLFVAYGLISVAIFFVIYPTAVELSTVAVAAVLLYTAPAWVALLAAFFFGESLTARKLGAIALTFAGSALVAGAYDPALLRGNLAGILAGLGSGLTYALFSIFGKAALRRHRPVHVMLVALVIGAGFLLPLVLRDLPSLTAPLRGAEGLALLAYIALGPTVGSLLLYTTGLQRLGDAGRASVIATIEPVAAALFGYVLLRESLAWPQWVGGALVLLGVLLVARGGVARVRPASEAPAAP